MRYYKAERKPGHTPCLIPSLNRYGREDILPYAGD